MYKTHVEITKVKSVEFPPNWEAPSVIEGVVNGIIVQIRGDDFPPALCLGGLLAGASEHPIDWKDE